MERHRGVETIHASTHRHATAVRLQVGNASHERPHRRGRGLRHAERRAEHIVRSIHLQHNIIEGQIERRRQLRIEHAASACDPRSLPDPARDGDDAEL